MMTILNGSEFYTFIAYFHLFKENDPGLFERKKKKQQMIETDCFK